MNQSVERTFQSLVAALGLVISLVDSGYGDVLVKLMNSQAIKGVVSASLLGRGLGGQSGGSWPVAKVTNYF
jgi:hypothetical protein